MSKVKSEKILVFRNEKIIKEVRATAEAAVPLLQKVIEQAAKSGLEITTENFYRATSVPEKFARENFEKTDKNVLRLVEQLGIKTAAAVEMVALPDVSDFSKAACNFFDYAKTKIVSANILKIEDGKAAINEKEFAAFVENQTVYAITEKEIKFWQLLLKMAATMNEFNDTALKDCRNMKTKIHPYDFTHFFTTSNEQQINDREIVPLADKYVEIVSRW